MSFLAQNAKGIQNKKILENLEVKNSCNLLKTDAVPVPPTVVHPTTSGIPDSNFQRAQTLQSSGFFIVSDSTYDNSILPVLPRIEK